MCVSVVGLLHAGPSGFKARALTLRLVVWARLIYDPSRAWSNSHRQRREEGSSSAQPREFLRTQDLTDTHLCGVKTPQTHCR